MNLKTWTQATLASAIVMWLLAGFWHMVVMPQFYVIKSQTDHEGTGIIFIAYLVLASLMGYLFPFKNPCEGMLTQGVKFGALMGILWVFPHGLAMSGAHGEPLAYVFKNAIWHIIEQSFGGLVIAFVYQRNKEHNL